MTLMFRLFCSLSVIVSIVVLSEDQSCEDVISRYIVFTPGSPHKAMSVKFRSLVIGDISYWYDDNTEEGMYQGYLKFGQETTITSYPGHRFYFKNARRNEILFEVEITSDQVRNSYFYIFS